MYIHVHEQIPLAKIRIIIFSISKHIWSSRTLFRSAGGDTY